MPLLLATLALAQGARALPPGTTTVRDIVYAHEGGAAFTMDEVRPSRPNGMAVLNVVSGGWNSAHTDINPRQAIPFTERGITLFQVVHGSQPRYKIPEMQRQLLKAVRYVRANAAALGVDPDRIGITGGSSGGHLSLMVGALGDDGNPDAKDPVARASSRVQAIVAYFPPTDMVNFGGAGVLASDIPFNAVFRGAFATPMTAPREAVAAELKALSPIYGVTPAFPPTLVIQGDADPIVPMQQAVTFDAALARAGVAHRLVIVKGGGHGGKGFSDPTEQSLWFAAHLRRK